MHPLRNVYIEAARFSGFVIALIELTTGIATVEADSIRKRTSMYITPGFATSIAVTGTGELLTISTAKIAQLFWWQHKLPRCLLIYQRTYSLQTLLRCLH